ncbi:hypothetical protein [Streptomyces olindensis]|uniref:hypothetical protein n=1 Tax=Streptomyces olindensis TaxID=358823 RepID=UPI00364E8558
MTPRQHRHTTTSLALTIAAVLCTAYTADTNWRFAEHHLGMSSAVERALFVVAGALALVANVAMAPHACPSRQLHSRLPQVLVWLITGLHVIAAYAESGLVAGTVRAVIGPILAALLWHFVFDNGPCHCVLGTDRQSRLPQRRDRTRMCPLQLPHRRTSR